jgi:hypothetical protein
VRGILQGRADVEATGFNDDTHAPYIKTQGPAAPNTAAASHHHKKTPDGCGRPRRRAGLVGMRLFVLGATGRPDSPALCDTASSRRFINGTKRSDPGISQESVCNVTLLASPRRRNPVKKRAIVCPNSTIFLRIKYYTHKVITPSGYAAYTLPEVIALQKENHIASRELFRKMRLLVDKRLLKEITLEKFKVDRLEAMELQAVLHALHESLRTEIQFRRGKGYAQGKLNPQN